MNYGDIGGDIGRIYLHRQAANKTIGQGGFQEVEQMAMFKDSVCYQEEAPLFEMCWGLNSHCFPMVGMIINLIVGFYIPSIRIPY